MLVFGLLAVILLISGLSAGLSTAAGPAVPGARPTPVRLPGAAVEPVRVYYTTAQELQELAARYEPWEVQPGEGYAVFGLPPAEITALRARGLRVEPHFVDQVSPWPDIGRLPGQVEGIPGFPCYRTVAETYASAAQLALDHPGLAAWVDIGDSWKKLNNLGGSDLMVLKLTNQAQAGPRPVFFILSAIHARELATAELSLRFAEYLLANYQVDPDVTWLLDETEIHFLLHANPDGRQMVEIGGTYWRKNTNANYCSADLDWRGADLNRNFSFEWGCCGGSSALQCDETYRGPAAASEPETQAVEAYLRTIFPDRRAAELSAPAPLDTRGLFLDIHSYSRLVLWPWGFTGQPAPNGEQLQTLGRKLAYFNQYEPFQAYDLYPTDGTTDDFAYGELGVPALTFEIGTSFYESCTSFETTVLPDNLEALLYAARAAHQPYWLPAGPEAIELALTADSVQVGETLTVTAMLDDSRFQQSNGAEPVQAIAGGHVYLDQLPWEPGAQPVGVLQPLDGVFDSPQEAVQFVWSPVLAAPGRHQLYLQAEDALGNRGVPSAVFVDVSGVQAGFVSSSPTVLGATTVFTDTSQGEIVARLWDLGDGFLTTTTAARLEHDYQSSGAFTVTLTVSGTLNASQQQQPVYILQPWMNLLPVLKDGQPGAESASP
jgi:hypothetical protein